MAHKKGAGSSNNGRESHSKRLGIKLYGGQLAIAGNIIVRQRGTKHHPDRGVGIGKDHTLFALIDGTVVFRKKTDNKSYVSIVPAAVAVPEPVKTVASKQLAAEAAAPEITTEAAKPKKAPKKEAEKVAEAEPSSEPATEAVASSVIEEVTAPAAEVAEPATDLAVPAEEEVKAKKPKKEKEDKEEEA